MPKFLLRVVALIAASVLLAACGGSDDPKSSKDDKTKQASTPSPSESDNFLTDVAPASGKEVRGDGFVFTAPKGWIDITDKLPGVKPLTAWASPKPDGNFTSNVNVLKEAVAGTDVETYTTSNIAQLKSLGYTDVKAQDPAGEYGVVTWVGDQQGTRFQGRQYYAIRDNEGWVITFSFAEGAPENKTVELSESVMKTFKRS